MKKTVILGAGLSGLSASYFIGHHNCTILEQNSYSGGHIHSNQINGFTWDEGPHVSFTKNDFVKKTLETSLGTDNILDYPVQTTNYFEGHWIPHPAQSNLYAVPENLRKKVFEGFLESRNEKKDIKNYEDWLIAAFGQEFYEHFSKKYTEKYWTTHPENLGTDWVGERVFYPDIETVTTGFKGPQNVQTHYIKRVRYPKNGGYMSFAKGFTKNAEVIHNQTIDNIDLENKRIRINSNQWINYDRLINTIPLPNFVGLCNAPEVVESASKDLSCSSVLLINIAANHATKRKDNWIYVYDLDKYSVRINCTELLSPNNAPTGKSGIQVEVYFSKYRKREKDIDSIKNKVVQEIIEMGLLNSEEDILDVHTKWVQWANIIFDHEVIKAKEVIFDWLGSKGMNREYDDLKPMTDWGEKFNRKEKFGKLILAGRFAQWKYFWTDDCILRGKHISNWIN